jgi:hypothetical protein
MKRHRLLLDASESVLGITRSDALRQVASTALADGWDSPSLRALAGSTASDPDARVLFERALSELGLSMPTAREAVMVLAHHVAAKVLQGTITPYEAAQRISDLSLRLPVDDDRLPQLDTFIYAASEWDDRPEDVNVFAEGVVAAARDLLESSTSP